MRNNSKQQSRLSSNHLTTFVIALPPQWDCSVWPQVALVA
jgi:hypothetical protein